MFIGQGVVNSRTPKGCYVGREKISPLLYQCRVKE
jgi:hypothetical protein